MSFIRKFIGLESIGGIMLFFATLSAFFLANSSLSHIYHDIWNTSFGFDIGVFSFVKPFELWINDGLMSIFFLLVGLEIKREMVLGELRHPSHVVLPGVAAVFGMLIPAGIFAYFNWGFEAIKGWPIPVATDIAFSLGILSLLGNRVSTSLKMFLTTLAIFDDIGAIVIIALFLTSHLSILFLALSLGIFLILLAFARFGVEKIWPYLLFGVVLWYCILQSGVHASISGVLLAFAIPTKSRGTSPSVGNRLERAIHPYVTFLILPIFALANAGFAFSLLKLETILHDHLSLGIAAGLLIGKQLGIFVIVWLLVTLKIVKPLNHMRSLHIYGVSLICGVGFTMSLFMGSLIFDGDATQASIRLGVFCGSFLSGLFGYLVIRFSSQADTEHANFQNT